VHQELEAGTTVYCYAVWSSYCPLHCENKTKLQLYFDDNELL